MTYMVVERFTDAAAVYRPFRDQGRMAPPGLTYVGSWVDHKIERCYQVMEANDRRLLDGWIARWSDIVEFEVVPVTRRKKPPSEWRLCSSRAAFVTSSIPRATRPAPETER